MSKIFKIGANKINNVKKIPLVEKPFVLPYKLTVKAPASTTQKTTSSGGLFSGLGKLFKKVKDIKISKEIDTYETSIMPYEDCCTIFDPKNPTTKPRLSECEKFESMFDFKSLIEEAIENAIVETITVE